MGEKPVAGAECKIVVAAAIINESEIGTFNKRRETRSDIDEVNPPERC